MNTKKSSLLAQGIFFTLSFALFSYFSFHMICEYFFLIIPYESTLWKIFMFLYPLADTGDELGLIVKAITIPITSVLLIAAVLIIHFKNKEQPMLDIKLIKAMAIIYAVGLFSKLAVFAGIYFLPFLYIPDVCVVVINILLIISVVEFWKRYKKI